MMGGAGGAGGLPLHEPSPTTWPKEQALSNEGTVDFETGVCTGLRQFVLVRAGPHLSETTQYHPSLLLSDA